MAERLEFTRHVDGMVTVNGFPSEIEATRDAIQQFHPRYVQVEGEYLVISVANGGARYKRKSKHPTLPLWTYEREFSGPWEDPEPAEPAWKKAIWG